MIGSDLDCQDLIAASDGNSNTEPTQKDEKTEDEADKVCLVNHTTGLLAALGGGWAPRKSHLAATRRVHRRGLRGEVARPLGRPRERQQQPRQQQRQRVSPARERRRE